MNCWEALYIYLHCKHDTLVPEQQVNDTNPLFNLAYIPRDLQHIPWISLYPTSTVYTCQHDRVSPFSYVFNFETCVTNTK